MNAQPWVSLPLTPAGLIVDEPAFNGMVTTSIQRDGTPPERPPTRWLDVFFMSKPGRKAKMLAIFSMELIGIGTDGNIAGVRCRSKANRRSTGQREIQAAARFLMFEESKRNEDLEIFISVHINRAVWQR